MQGRKVELVPGDTRSNTDDAHDDARRMIERDGAITVTGSATSGEAIAAQLLYQERGVICLAGPPHSNDATGKDKRRYGFQQFFNACQSGVAIAPCHLTADYA